ncbi:MAG: rhomboid family intramembrane serine protease [Chlorobi bacterium]|nr:rhomboid family intramembrane serine protease [Chlorobiota bacterium]
MNNIEKRRLKLSLIIPVFLLMLMWIVKFYEYSFDISFSDYGIYPGKMSGLRGILLSPFIHKDFSHLYSNSLPFLILGSSLFYFYKNSALKVFVLIWTLSGFWVWIFGRTSYHIGASGIIYGFASFIFFSGVINKSKSLLSVSLLVVFLYGSMVWGVLPIKPEISWESHLLGAATGFILALIYSPDKKTYPEDDEDDFYFPIFIKSDKFCDLG